jgi:molybdopterin synthase catalytic subunit
LRGAQTVLTVAAAERISRVVLLSSAMVYGARPDNPVPLPEDAPLLAAADGSLAGDLLEVEQLARRSRRVNPSTAVTVVRPAALVGGAIDTLLTRHFEAPRLLAVRGCEPQWQFCHIADLASALELAARGLVSGDLAVGCDGWLSRAEVEEISGLKSIELPAKLTFGTAQRLHRLGVTPAPAAELHYEVYPWVVDCAMLRAAGWAPEHDNASVLRALLAAREGRHAVAGRRIARKEAAITAAAGAAAGTAAAIGAAAIVRHARKKGDKLPARAKRLRPARSRRARSRSLLRSLRPGSAVRLGAGVVRYLGDVSQMRLIAIRDAELSVDEVRAAVADPAAGGIVLFLGAVRDNDEDRGVTGLGYSAHPSAEAELRRVTEEIVAKYSDDVIGVAAVHRVGDLDIGDLAVVVGVSCGHRAEAFEACHALIDELKASVPVWKHQRFTDGSSEWVGSA